MKTLIPCMITLVLALGGYALYQASAKEPVKPVVVQADPFEIVCRARLANLMIRTEWRDKAEGERFKEYRSYMGSECVK